MDDYFDLYIKYKRKYLNLKYGGSVKIDYLTLEEIDELFNNRNGYVLDEEDQKKYDDENSVSTYGELTLEGLKKIIETSQNIMGDLSHKKYVDLGSGTGRTVVLASNYFGESYGIELSKKRNDIGKKILEDYGNRIQNEDNILLINGDMYDMNCRDKDVVYISSLCFTDTMMDRLKNKLNEELKIGSLIFTSKELDLNENDNLERLENINVKMTWSDSSTLYVYRKI